MARSILICALALSVVVLGTAQTLCDGDLNDDGATNVQDIIAQVNYILGTGDLASGGESTVECIEAEYGTCWSDCPNVCGEPEAFVCNMMCRSGYGCPSNGWAILEDGEDVPNADTCCVEDEDACDLGAAVYDCMEGDFNGDDAVTVNDVIILVNAILEGETIEAPDSGSSDSDSCECSCDIDCDCDFDVGYGDCASYDAITGYNNYYCAMDGACGNCCECEDSCDGDSSFWSSPIIVAGRPLRWANGTESVVADVCDSAFGWSHHFEPVSTPLTADEKEILSQAWARAGLAEHASVASFSKHAIELMAVGSPASMLESVHNAALDEIEHAKLCFGLAEKYSSKTQSPGPIPVADAVQFNSDVTSVVRGVVEEGCIAETLSAVIAAVKLTNTNDVDVKSVLKQITEDESRHAKLAWETAAWMLEQDNEAAKTIAEVFGNAASYIPDFADEDVGALPSELRSAQGWISKEEYQTIAKTTIREMIQPWGQLLLKKQALTFAESSINGANQVQENILGLQGVSMVQGLNSQENTSDV